jgi:hypothetical protein
VDSIAADRKWKKPVLNSENGYEYLRGNPSSKKQVHHTDKVRRTSWRIMCAGGYFAAGFHGTLGHSDAWNRIDAPNRYDFSLHDEGAALQLGILYNYFAALPFWKMEPYEGATGDAVTLAETGKNYVAYLPHGGRVTLDLSAVTAPLTARWFDPRKGKYLEPIPVENNGRRDFNAPDSQDWVLQIQAAAAASN